MFKADGRVIREISDMKIDSRNLKDLLISEEKAVDEAMRKAVRHALLTHKRAGHPVAS